MFLDCCRDVVSSVRIVITTFSEHSVGLQLDVSAVASAEEEASADALTMLELFRSLNNRSGPLIRVLNGLQNILGRRKSGIFFFPCILHLINAYLLFGILYGTLHFICVYYVVLLNW